MKQSIIHQRQVPVFAVKTAVYTATHHVLLSLKAMRRRQHSCGNPNHMTTSTTTAIPASRQTRALLWGIFAVYLLLLAHTIAHHELWADELHSWNIAKGSTSFINLLQNTRYEGHPPLWYTLLWLLSKCTHSLTCVQVLHWFIAGTAVYLLLFRSPFSLPMRIVLPFGYFFLYEYAAFSRNYAIALVLAFCLCLLLQHNRKQSLLYYLLLFLLSNTHLLGLVLAAALHLYYLLQQGERQAARRQIILQALAGMLVLLPALCFIAPPSNSEMNAGFWASHWNSRQLLTLVQLPQRAFIPIPAWWNYHWWNTTFLLNSSTTHPALKLLNPLLSPGLLLLACFILRNNRKSLLLFAANFAASCAVSLIFPLNSARYAGFVFIAFIAALWLYQATRPIAANRVKYVYALLCIQLLAAIPALARDWQYPFSNDYRVHELLQQIPAQEKAVTDYWALNTISAYADKPFYCADLQKEVAYILWTSEFSAMLHRPHPFYNGVKTYCTQQGIQQVYLLSVLSPVQLQQADALLFTAYKVNLVDKREGAIEPGSNLYLYKISGQ
ncbi:hypothetical protein [Deminuibacter soli]|uniref:Glycosyltransferase RgtA/B/C/D-like domain-containing protein n=1 Tax=Deminuibacter soli TaxID=2291815 RepID=A0A3E1NIQ0_9BACT|nr:hypothetical protein [Deminuibacter soli]RFM27807.1 hypothetical protein DXN05_14015 [Deminuibacter soli]